MPVVCSELQAFPGRLVMPSSSCNARMLLKLGTRSLCDDQSYSKEEACLHGFMSSSRSRILDCVVFMILHLNAISNKLRMYMLCRRIYMEQR
jgi:hypothetical protein